MPDDEIPKNRLAPRHRLLLGATAVALAAGGLLLVRACLPPEPPMQAAERDLVALGCAPGAYVIGVSLPGSFADAYAERSWGYDCVVPEDVHPPDCDEVARRWAASANGGLAPFDILVRQGDPHDRSRPPLCHRRYDGKGVSLGEVREPVR